jgi:hypothetical protein
VCKSVSKCNAHVAFATCVLAHVKLSTSRSYSKMLHIVFVNGNENCSASMTSYYWLLLLVTSIIVRSHRNEWQEIVNH